MILQDLCRKKYGWDDAVPEDDAQKWRCWLEILWKLSEVEVPRCFIRPEFEYNTLLRRELHHFADASSAGYDTVSYLRVVGPDGTMFYSFVLGKSRLAPLKKVSILRLEFTAATMAARVDSMLRSEMDKTVTNSVFWTDSLVVLFMIRNIKTRFPVFVANRLAQIEEMSEPSQWRFVDDKSNPADVGTRAAATGQELERWLSGPSFLQEPANDWPTPPCDFPDLPEEFRQLKQTVATSKVVETGTLASMEQRFERFSSFYKLKKAVAWILRLKGKSFKALTHYGPLTVDEISEAEIAIIKAIQKESFPKDYEYLNSDKALPLGNVASNPLKKLNPVSVSGVLHVGGRLCRSSYEFDVKHPVIMPSNSHVTSLLIEEYHRKVRHSGASHTWTSLRQRYWVVKGAGTIRKVLGHCLFCKLLWYSIYGRFASVSYDCR